jgi:uncharacterized protein YceH (UPF0502 family)
VRNDAHCIAYQYNPPVPLLTPNEVRVLGSLIEKQITTPEYYPLTLNALTLACNQKNNRNPVTALTEAEVEQALDSLREKNLAYVFYGSTSRVPKYKHVADNLHLSAVELSVICVLMLSGAQTVGEIRGRAYRLYESSGSEEIEQAIHSLATKDEPLVIKLPRLTGQKEARFAHLLAGEVQIELESEQPISKQSRKSADAEKVVSLEHRVEALAGEVESLRLQFEQFKKQFE